MITTANPSAEVVAALLANMKEVRITTIRNKPDDSKAGAAGVPSGKSYSFARTTTYLDVFTHGAGVLDFFLNVRLPLQTWRPKASMCIT